MSKHSNIEVMQMNQLQSWIDQTQEVIKLTKEALATDPERPSLLASLKSYEKRLAELEAILGEDEVKQKIYTDNRGFLESMAKSYMEEHDPETCGMCYNRKIMSDVAQEMLDNNEIENGINTWSKRIEEKWHESKFFKLYQEEQAAGRDPQKAFDAKGWEM